MSQGEKIFRYIYKGLILGGILLSLAVVFLPVGSVTGFYMSTQDLYWVVWAINIGLILYMVDFILSRKERFSKRGIDKLNEWGKLIVAILSLCIGLFVAFQFFS